jgi:hypothetical protein
MENQQPPRKNEDDEMENLRIGYQTAVQLWASQSEQLWSGFNAMVVANSIILGAIGLLFASKEAPPALKFTLPAVGIVLSIAWLAIVKRHFHYQDYYINSARELEEKDDLKPIKTVSRGADFAEHKEVSFQIKAKKPTLQTQGLGRIPVRWSSVGVIVIFGVVYGIALFSAC